MDGTKKIKNPNRLTEDIREQYPLVKNSRIGVAQEGALYDRCVVLRRGELVCYTAIPTRDPVKSEWGREECVDPEDPLHDVLMAMMRLMGIRESEHNYPIFRVSAAEWEALCEQARQS